MSVHERKPGEIEHGAQSICSVVANAMIDIASASTCPTTASAADAAAVIGKLNMTSEAQTAPRGINLNNLRTDHPRN
jgi:hypothetical protein